MKPELKKLLVLNLPYLLFVYLFAKCGQTYRLSAGVDASAKLLHLTDGISAAFASPLPSLHPFDLCVGVVGAVAVRLIVYSKGKNAKKYRKGEEYGSARWGTAKDIAPYIDPKFENNILLTQTERLTMTGRQDAVLRQAQPHAMLSHFRLSHLIRSHRPEGLQCIRTEKNRTNKEMFLLITAQGKEVSYGTEKGQICGTV